ncbi:hypothetical protein RF11_08456 [Thelohanellus kitauei]|uniref:Reverse transcriptase domain-containing protein n=1 Tax=Thelohanellus kitauei TaxID=669202 RepID=A0A0C2MRA2_THEKT|nr:hypothetical protein RF11_08456 [Thelohanellus kitauei]
MKIRQCDDKNTSARHSLNFVVTKHHNLNLLGLKYLNTLQISIDTSLHSIRIGNKKGVWVPVQFNDSGTPIVPVKKGETGMWVNESLYHEYPIPSPGGFLNKICGCNYLSKIDFSEAYNHVKISPELPFGIKSAHSYFQNLIAQLTVGLERVATYLDDILVSGTDDASHISNIRAIVDYLVCKLTLSGKCKVSGGNSVLKMRTPYDLSSRKSSIGSIQFYHKFIHNLVMVASP